MSILYSVKHYKEKYSWMQVNKLDLSIVEGDIRTLNDLSIRDRKNFCDRGLVECFHYMIETHDYIIDTMLRENRNNRLYDLISQELNARRIR